MRAGSSFRARVLLGIALFYVILGNVNGDLIFGQSFDNSSTTKDFSRPVWEGILTAFDEINSVYGGVRNTNLTLLAMDDQYNATISVANCLELVNNGSLALLGNVGTGQTAASNNKLLSLNKTVPIIGPVTGAYAARVPLQETFIHLGASYEDESIAMVKYAVGTLLLNRISVFYQNDAFGQAGVLALKKSLKSVNLEIFSEGNFPGTATDPELMRPGLLSLTKNGTVRPQAIVFVTVVSQTEEPFVKV
ncbi:periplasmic binding protein-like I [Paraphysoderma sedebokerense]|nr:periplasmic binding protein-like I [Paraphysoderma sedebokerense]